jgi:hypothetical protein
LQSSVVSLPGAARQQLQHEKRAQRIADRTELEMSSDDDSTDVSSPHSTSSTSSTSPTTVENRLEQRILTILQRLQAIHIALETLENTGIGKVVKRLTNPTKPPQRMFPDSVIGEAKRLIAKWRTTAEEGLSRRKRRKASGVDDVVVPHWKKGKLQFHGFNNKKQRRRKAEAFEIFRRSGPLKSMVYMENCKTNCNSTRSKLPINTGRRVKNHLKEDLFQFK